MQAQRFNVTIEEDHQILLDLPHDFPSGPAEVIVLAERIGRGKMIRLGGVLQRKIPEPGDPIADALAELRTERDAKLCNFRSSEES